MAPQNTDTHLTSRHQTSTGMRHQALLSSGLCGIVFITSLMIIKWIVAHFMISFNSHNNTRRWKDCCFPHFTDGKAEAPERVSSLPKATQLASGRTGIRTQAVQFEGLRRYLAPYALPLLWDCRINSLSSAASRRKSRHPSAPLPSLPISFFRPSVCASK